MAGPLKKELRRSVCLRLAVGGAFASLLGMANVEVPRLALAAGQSETAMTESLPGEGAVVSGMQSSISFAARVFERGEPIQFRYRLTNQSSQPVTIWNAGFWGTHRLLLEGLDGTLPPLTLQGAQALDAF